MQTIRWIAFGFSNAATDTYIHFFPSSGNVSAPYPALCKVSCFFQGEQWGPVTLEGARLSQPDGVRIADLFSDLPSGSNPFGIEIALSTVQPRVDLQASSCVIEIASRAYSARYRPRGDSQGRGGADEHGTYTPSRAMALKDAYQTSSVIIVNSSQSGVKSKSAGAAVETSSEMVFDMPAPWSASEVASDYADIESRDFSWGAIQCRAVDVADSLPKDVSAFEIFRDNATGVPVSVVVL